MRVQYKNNLLEKIVLAVNVLAGIAVGATFVLQFGFESPLVNPSYLHIAQVVLLCVFILEKIVRGINARSVWEYLVNFWFEIPFIIGLAVVLIWMEQLFNEADPVFVRKAAIGIYLVIQVISKLCRTVVNLAAAGKNAMITLIASFLFLIFAGSGLLMLPRSAADENIGFVDALFTSTSATCVTGLIVVDTGSDFSFMGQLIILTLIQLGGLGIIVFGAVFSVLLGQALSLKESVAMQDLLSAESLGRLGNMIVFIFVFTLLFEAIGAMLMVDMWNNVPGWEGGLYELWFCSIFHSISAFCNAGFSLFSDSFIRYSGFWQIYGVVCPLIILGGLGFGVLYNLANLAGNRIKRLLKQLFNRHYRFSMETPKRMRLQTKIVLSASLILIVTGMLGIIGFETAAGQGGNFLDGLFQSVTARTAGFNTVNIAELSASSKLLLIILMFIGGSPGSAAGGIKTVTLAVIILTMIAAFRKRSEVECFNRSIRIVVVGRAITVVLLFILVLFAAVFTLSVTERGNDFAMSDIIFEATSALGTVGLSTGITSSLTAMGKLTIIAVMLIGRLGPLTLLAALTFNLKPVNYSYPEEPLIVG